MSEPKTLSAGKPIDQGELMDALAADGLIDAADARRLRYTPRAREGVTRHPVNFVADQQLVSPADARPLGIERVLGWLAQRTGPGGLPHRPAENQRHRRRRGDVPRLRRAPPHPGRGE